MDSIIIIPKGNSSEDIKEREKIIRHFYHRWKEENPSQRRYNLSLKEYINIRMVSIIETSKTKKNNKNQEPFERMMIMEYELIGIGKVKMTVGIRRRTKEKIQYCITAISGI